LTPRTWSNINPDRMGNIIVKKSVSYKLQPVFIFVGTCRNLQFILKIKGFIESKYCRSDGTTRSHRRVKIIATGPARIRIISGSPNLYLVVIPRSFGVNDAYFQSRSSGIICTGSLITPANLNRIVVWRSKTRQTTAG